MSRNSQPEVFLGKDVQKICSKFVGKHPCRSVISTNLFCNFTEITLRHGCSPVNLQHISRTHFYQNTSGGLLLDVSQGLRYTSAMSESVLFHYLKKDIQIQNSTVTGTLIDLISMLKRPSLVNFSLVFKIYPVKFNC